MYMLFENIDLHTLLLPNEIAIKVYDVNFSQLITYY